MTGMRTLPVTAGLLALLVSIGAARAQQDPGLERLNALWPRAAACEAELRDWRGRLDRLSLELSGLNLDGSPEAARRRDALRAELEGEAAAYAAGAAECAAAREEYAQLRGSLETGCGAEMLEQAIALTKAGRGAEALDLADRRMGNGACIGLDRFDLLRARGVALLGLARWDEAASAFTAALAPDYRLLPGGRSSALIGRSVARIFLGRPNMALADLDEADAAVRAEVGAGTAATEDRGLYHLVRAFALYALGRNDAALADLEQAGTDEMPVRLALSGLAHLAMGDADRAARDLGQAQDLADADAQAAFLIGLAFPDWEDRLEEALGGIGGATVDLIDVVLTPSLVRAGEDFAVVVRVMADDPGAEGDVLDVRLAFRMLRDGRERVDLGTRPLRIVRGEAQSLAEMLQAVPEAGIFTLQVELGYGETVAIRNVTLEVI